MRTARAVTSQSLEKEQTVSMSRIQLHLPAFIHDVVGVRSMDVPTTSLAEALKVPRSHPVAGPLLFDEAGELREKFLTLVNDRLVKAAVRSQFHLKPGDRVAIVMSVWGG
jgi:sulfur carrier protein ThiS